MKKIKTELLKNTGDFGSFREADKIIAYLGNPDSTEHKITIQQKMKLDRYQLIHGLRMRFKSHKYIIGHLATLGRNERQARYDIAEAEYIFGAAINVSRQYEMAFLLEASRKNIAIAIRSKDSQKISKALDTHHKLLGEEADQSALPDFSKFEQHNYNMVLPDKVMGPLMQLLSSGALNLSDAIPPQMLNIKANDEPEAK